MFGIGPKVFAALIGLIAAAIVTVALVSAAGSIMDNVKRARDGEWSKRISDANAKAIEAQRLIIERANQAAEALRKQQAAEESAEHAIERAIELQKLVDEMRENPVCIPHAIVRELHR